MELPHTKDFHVVLGRENAERDGQGSYKHDSPITLSRFTYAIRIVNQ